MQESDYKRDIPILYVVLPCFNEEKVLPLTIPEFEAELKQLTDEKLISPLSRLLFVDDGSSDETWKLITREAELNEHVIGMRQSRNRGHQSTILAGMLEAGAFADAVITADCDGQDDIAAMHEMVKAYLSGCDIVYGVRRRRSTDTAFKRITARGFYKLMQFLGAETVYDHADYRLVSKRIIDELKNFDEVNLYLRGIFPLIGFKSTSVLYDRRERQAGSTHYPIGKMLKLAANGITSFSIKPLHIIFFTGAVLSVLSLAGIAWSIYEYMRSATIPGWSSTVCIVCLLSGVQLLSLGVLGEYLGKIYMEVKQRPRYIISEKTWNNDEVHP